MRRVSLLAILAATGAAADVPSPTATESEGLAVPGSIYLLAGVEPAYEVKEYGKHLGVTTVYDWEGTDAQAPAFAIGWTRPVGGTRDSHAILGVELLASVANLKPTTVTVGSTTYAAQNQSFTYQSGTVSAVGGWRWSFPSQYTESMVPSLEVQGLAGATVMNVNLDVPTDSYSSYGVGADVAARVVFGLAERGFMLGIAGGVHYGRAFVDTTNDAPGDTQLKLIRQGGEIFAVGSFDF
jgi:hypothetical protein